MSVCCRRLLELEEAVSEVQLLRGGEGRKSSQQYLAFMEVRWTEVTFGYLYRINYSVLIILCPMLCAVFCI